MLSKYRTPRFLNTLNMSCIRLKYMTILYIIYRWG